MSLLSQLTEDYKNAMRAHEETKKTILNYVLAQAKYKKIELQKDPEDADVVAILKKEIKALDEAIGFLEKTEKTQDLAEEKQKKLILQAYLPATMSREATTELVEKLIIDLGITDLAKQRGMLMKDLMANYKSEIDGSLVNEIINSKLAPPTAE